MFGYYTVCEGGTQEGFGGLVCAGVPIFPGQGEPNIGHEIVFDVHDDGGGGALGSGRVGGR